MTKEVETGISVRSSGILLRLRLGSLNISVRSVDAGKVAGIDNAHEQISDVRTMPGLKKQRVLAVPDSLFQRYFADCYPAEHQVPGERESTVPRVDHVRESLLHARVWSNLLLLYLRLQPIFKLIH